MQLCKRVFCTGQQFSKNCCPGLKNTYRKKLGRLADFIFLPGLQSVFFRFAKLVVRRLVTADRFL